MTTYKVIQENSTFTGSLRTGTLEECKTYIKDYYDVEYGNYHSLKIIKN